MIQQKQSAPVSRPWSQLGPAINRSFLFGVLPLILTTLVFFIWPLTRILFMSFFDDGITLTNYQRILTTPIYGRVLFNTLYIALLTTLGTLVLSYPLAYYMATARPTTAKILAFAVLLPFWTSALVRTTAWIILLQRNGMLNTVLTSTGVVNAPIAFVYNLSGVLIGMVHVLMPFMVLPLYAAFRNIDRNLLYAAEGMGASPFQRFVRIIMPLTAPGAAAGSLIVFMNALGYYITPALLGGPRQTMIAEMISFHILEQLDWGMAAALAMLLLVVTLVLFLIFQTLLGLDKLLGGGGNGDGDTLGNAQGDIKRSLLEKFAAVAAVFVAIFLVLPNLVVVPMSFSPSPFYVFPPEQFTTRWFSTFFENPKWIQALWNSLQVSAIAVTLATILGTLAAIGVSRLNARGKSALEAYFLLPMVVPPVIFGIALYYFYAPIGLIGRPLGLAIGHAILGTPFVFLTVRAALKNFDPNLELAALGLGASRITVLRRIMLPQLWPGIVAGAVFAFIVSFDDVLLALFITNIRSRTLPKLMYEGVAYELDPTITAVATLLIGVAIVILSGHLLFGSRRKSS